MPIRRFSLLLAATSAVVVSTSACATSNSSERGVGEQRTTLRVAGTGPTIIHTEAGIEERTLASPPETVWATLPAVFGQLDVPVTHSDPARFEMGNQSWRPRRIEGRRMSKYIDCGSSLSGALADTHEITMMMMVRVERAPGGGATVTTIMDAFGDPRAVSGNNIHCQSLGTLEDRVQDLIWEKLRAGDAP